MSEPAPPSSTASQTSAWLTWLDGTARRGVCRACGHDGLMAARARIKNPFNTPPEIDYLECPTCGSLVAPEFVIPDYRNEEGGGPALKFAKEQGAGIQSMIAPLYWLDTRTIESFLDVGGGYGFALDAARTLMGWRVSGADPSPFARTGAEELNLEIADRYVSAGDPAEGAPFDLVLASEVIEHVDDPVDFARTLAACAGENGRVLLTTPDPDIVLSREDEAAAMMALAPGYHVSIYSRDGLKRIMADAGFSFVDVHRNGGSLVIAAGHAPFEIDPDRTMPARDYRAYLNARATALNPRSDIRFGFLARLARANADAGHWPGVKTDLDQLAEFLTQRYGIDLYAPQDWQDLGTTVFNEVSEAMPFGLGSVFFVLGLYWLNVKAERARAADAFDAAERAARAARGGLLEIGADDLDLQQIEGRARLHHLHALGWADPDRACEQFLPLWDAGFGLDTDRLVTLCALLAFAGEASGEAVTAMFERAEAYFDPILSGAREPKNESEHSALTSIAQAFERAGHLDQARPWRWAAERTALSQAAFRAAQSARLSLDQALDHHAATSDLQAVADAASHQAHRGAEGPAARALARGPHNPALNQHTRMALALRCLVREARPEFAAALLESSLESADAKALYDSARAQLNGEGGVGRLTTLAAGGDWAGIAILLSVWTLPDLESLDEGAAFAFGLYQLRLGGDFDQACRAFELTTASSDHDLAAAAKAHLADALAQSGEVEAAKTHAQALLAEAEAGDEALQSHAELLRRLTGSD